MKRLDKFIVITAIAITIVVTAGIPVFADTYYSATFTGGVQWVRGGSFDGIAWDPAGVSGNFVYDANLIPGPGTGWVNVFFDNTSARGFPDVGNIPGGTLFTIHLGATPLTFTFADAVTEPYSFPPYHDAAIQYYNGNFNGFFFVSDFQYNGSSYRFDDQGGQWSIYAYSPMTGPGATYVSGYIDLAGMTTTGPYTPPTQQVPESSMILVLVPTLLGLVGMRKVIK
jgi:hypothetical protein